MKILAIVGTVLLAFCVFTFAQEPKTENKPLVKKTTAGVEVTLFEAAPGTDIEPMNRVPQFRMGACPPGAALGDMKIQADQNKDVIIVTLGLRFSASYKGPDFVSPVLVDSAGTEYRSRNMFEAPKGMAASLQKTGGQIRCEIPFEVPKGTQATKIKYDDAVFEIRDLHP